MIQDIYPKKLINHYDAGKKPSSTSPVLRFNDKGAFLVREREMEGKPAICFPERKDFPAASDERDFTFLFTIGTEDYFLLENTALPVPDGCEYHSIREMRANGWGPKDRVFAGATALQLYHWYQNNRYCGHCGTPTVRDTVERAIKCPHCGNTIYPRIVPAVIVAVTNGDKLLVTKYARGFSQYALVAGFTEIGETLEETVQREVMEEAGLKVKNIRYYKSQPWGIVDDLLAGFYCDVDGSDEIHMDRFELKLAEWRSREDVILQSDDFSLTNEMMMRFKEGKEPR